MIILAQLLSYFFPKFIAFREVGFPGREPPTHIKKAAGCFGAWSSALEQCNAIYD